MSGKYRGEWWEEVDRVRFDEAVAKSPPLIAAGPMHGGGRYEEFGRSESAPIARRQYHADGAVKNFLMMSHWDG